MWILLIGLKKYCLITNSLNDYQITSPRFLVLPSLKQDKKLVFSLSQLINNKQGRKFDDILKMIYVLNATCWHKNLLSHMTHD